MSIDIKEFKNPCAKYRGKPFWAWNGKLEKNELLKQVGFMKEMGMGGYFCHSRTGLATKYLGDEWFELINACADEGEKLGLETWLYDEDRWPSGTAGGMVTNRPEFRIKYIRLAIILAENFSWNDEILAAFSADLSTFAFTNKKRLYNGERPLNGSVLVFSLEEMGKSSFYNGFTYIDTMNPNATNEFIRITHEKYKEKCGDRLGKSIKGIFTDEPHRGSVMCGFCLPNDDCEYLTPYTDELFSCFKNKYNKDLMDYLPELFLWENGNKLHIIKWQYMELLQSLFIDNYLKPIQNWCADNNLILTGHVLHEDSLTAQTGMIGSVMRAYEFMDYPGVDLLGEHNNNYWIVKQLSSAARQLGKNNLMSELYGCTGWQMSFKSHKEVGDWQSLLGINLRCHHLSWYSMEGQAKRDYPASIFHQSSWFREYKYVEDYFSRIHLLLSQGDAICDVLVINPVESAWSVIYPKWSWYLATLDSDVLEVETKYEELFKILMQSGIDFDYGDEDMISRLYSIEKTKTDVYLRIGKARYRSVIVGKQLTIRSSTIKILKEFLNSGGCVVFAGDVPQYIDVVKNDEITKLNASFVTFDATNILKALKTTTIIKILDLQGLEIPDIYLQIRKNNSDYIFALMNLNRENKHENVQISIDVSGYLEKWDVRTGEVLVVGSGDKNIEIAVDFAPSEEKIFILTKNDNGYKHLKSSTILHEKVLPKSFQYVLTEPNVCVLDFAKLRINNGEWHNDCEILKIDEQIRSMFSLNQRGGEMIQPWARNHQTSHCIAKIDIEFEFFINELPNQIKLACENPNKFAISINDNKISVVDNMDYWCDTCFKIMPIALEDLKIGRNTVRLSCDFSLDTDLESLYILGDFGVKITGTKRELGSLPPKLHLRDITTQGLPFYGANIKFGLGSLEIGDIGDNEHVIIEIPNFSGACIKVSSLKSEKIIAFEPFEADITEMVKNNEPIEVELLLTRRNTFGPLHQFPINTGGVDPTSYITKGDNFLSDGYGVLGQGIFNEIIVRKAF